MKTRYLNSAYWQWLQKYPEQGRSQRTQAALKALKWTQQGEVEKAKNAHGQAYEMARAVLLALRKPEDQGTALQEDINAFGALAIQLARNCAALGDSLEAATLLADSAQQLQALAPLFFCEPQIIELLRDIDLSLQHGVAVYERQQLHSQTLH